MKDLKLSVKQYKNAIKNALSIRQIEILQVLYAFPNSTASAIELANALNYASYHGANRQIGEIGKVIANYLKVTPYSYYTGKKDTPAYFSLMGPYHLREGKKRGSIPGWEMKENLMAALLNLHLVSKEKSNVHSIDLLPTEEIFDQQRLYKEGKVIEVFVNRYERNKKARLDCIKHYGDSCSGCGFNFGKHYGNLAKGFIHVHHKTPLLKVKKEYNVDPVKDLIPLCANCHSVVHLTNPPMTIEELKLIMKKNKFPK